ncbi:hypothetical protein I656_01861 [Geobacillus sp. WSUCF1]|nr:hypothetical protein I656_01861 [Geobacillus sp. WSUCF1]
MFRSIFLQNKCQCQKQKHPLYIQYSGCAFSYSLENEWLKHECTPCCCSFLKN